jgi:hypothetical protein
MARAISDISSHQNQEFKKACIAIFNKRWKEFNIDIYMLAFFLHPKYRGKNINNIILLLYNNFIKF